MGRHKEAPEGFACPWRDRCPHLEGLSTTWMFAERQRTVAREDKHWKIRDAMQGELDALEERVQKQAAEIDRLTAENKHLHQSRFKARTKKKTNPAGDDNKTSSENAKDTPVERQSGNDKPPRKRGAPTGHSPWTRPAPDHVDRTVEVPAPCTCPHCSKATDQERTSTTSYTQEDIVLRPATLVTEWVHGTAWCPGCRRQVSSKLKGELPHAPIGPAAKAAALYLRHETKLPYRKIQKLMEDLFGLRFAPASCLGFEKRALGNAAPLYDDLIQKMRHSDLVHADETYWREDGENVYIWYAGNQDVAVYRIDSHRTTEAAKALLGDRINGLLVTDAYAAYNAINADGRQSCLAHLLRKAKEIAEVLASMKAPDAASVRFCRQLTRLFRLACRIKIPKKKQARIQLEQRMLSILDRVSGTEKLLHEKAETLRKRLLPGAREYKEVFAFIRFDGPPTNNHAERAIRPLVIFRKVCHGSRSRKGSENVAIFSSLAQTAKQQESSVIDLFKSLFQGSVAESHDQLFANTS